MAVHSLMLTMLAMLALHAFFFCAGAAASRPVDEARWQSSSTPTPTLAPSCTIDEHGAVSGNRTADAPKNAAAVQQALASCRTVVVPAGKTYKLAPVTIPANRTLFLDTQSQLMASDDPTHYALAHFLPPLGNSGTQPGMLQLAPLLSNVPGASNILITGRNGSIDGGGFFFWPAANWSRCVEQGTPCAQPPRFQQDSMPPHVVTFYHCSGCNMANVTVTNPAFWGVQHFFCNQTQLDHVTILAPRWTRQIAGFMPFSVRDYRVLDSYVAVGDDAVAIMSGPDFAGGQPCPPTQPCPAGSASEPTAGVLFERLFVLGRSVAIGSEDFGNVTDVVFRNCTIGDDAGSSPWAFKVKAHSNRGCFVGNMLLEDIKLGNITSNSWQDPGNSGGTALQMALAYSDPPINPALPQPRVGNITFRNVQATATKHAGHIVGGLNDIFGLHFDSCNFRSSQPQPWLFANVSAASCTAVNTLPDPGFGPGATVVRTVKK